MRTALLGLALLLPACHRAAPPGPDVAASLGGGEVRYSEFEGYLKSTAGESEGVLSSDVLSELFDQFLDERLLVRIAADRNLLPQGGGPREATDALLADGLKTEPSEAEIARYYEAHRKDFERPERVRLRQILTEDRATADQAVQQLAAGADFQALARRLSRDPSASTGGYQGELSRQDVPPAFEDAIFSLQPGEVSKVVPAEYGFHIFQVVSRSPAGLVPLADARDEIREHLSQEQADRFLADLVRAGRTHYNVTVHRRNLPFNYQGAYP